jgi:SAM-dependent methyltransferase
MIVLFGPNEFYETVYATSPHHIRPPQWHLYRRVVKKVGQGKILDIGCGHGYILSRLQSQQRLLYGLDIALGALKVARNWVEEGNFCVADAQSIPFKSNTFDYLLSTEVLEHIEGDDAVRECYRVLKSGGVALFTVPNSKGPHGRGDPEHVRFFIFESIINLLEARGFEIISGQKFGLYIPFVGPFFELLLRVSGNRLPLTSFVNIRVPEFLAANFYVECRKPTKEGG